MSQEQWEKEVVDYVDKTKFAVLAYVRNDQTPVLRSMGSFVPSGLDIYFSTRKDAAKVQEITGHKRVSFFFEHDNQELGQWKNLLFIGEAEKVDNGSELNRAVELLGNRNPRFKERVAKGDLPSTQIFRLKTKEIECLDYGKGIGHVQKITLQEDGSL
jgi:nitroimidazol reductase NimA-like FMN-containing flavoprotein (pyridoxamine 5'-phosphate oxidase superfamily)